MVDGRLPGGSAADANRDGLGRASVTPACDACVVGVVCAIAISTTIVDTSPFSTNGALVVANAPEAERDTVLRRLLIYSAVIAIVGPVLAWLSLVVPGWL